jgi:hypothetical protein
VRRLANVQRMIFRGPIVSCIECEFLGLLFVMRINALYGILEAAVFINW